MGYKNPNWEEDWNKLLKRRKHARMEKIIQKPNICPICGKKKKLDLTNINHKYNEDPSDWVWKCRSCHMKYDKKLSNDENE